MITDIKMPFCPGCGHTIATKNIAMALEEMGLNPLDIIVVSDIGCCGIVDPVFTTHTIHGLHGRSTVLAMGISLGLADTGKKVIAIQGDGGATIGLQHLLEASRRNVNMTLIVLNNMVYGMTGGQMSALSQCEFKSLKVNEESNVPPYDICRLAHQAGAAYCSRITIGGKFSDKLKEAFQTKGFSLVEINGMCPSYGIKKIDELQQLAKKELTLKNECLPYYVNTKKTSSLFDSIQHIEGNYNSEIKSKTGIIIAGSAGEGIQSAAQLLANAGIISGLHVSLKGEYPVTVGTGFSVAEVIFSREKIHFTGLITPDVMIITSNDGMKKVIDMAGTDTQLIVDKNLESPAGLNVMKGNFRTKAGKKGASLNAIAYWLQQSNLLSIEALLEAAKKHKYADKMIADIKISHPYGQV